ncbi:MAG: HPr(Ser) kinase/phosphatase [Clostridia bacterium]|nr:HPr(Ser) kinase/phosphatase [Clostridia bacterium]MBQ4622922.1 HPr(Ser) kinase/phosphatase [Clostridia bacterium]
MQDLPTPHSFENTQSAESKYSIKLKQIIEEFGLTVYYGPEGYENTEIRSDDIIRPGLQLAGYFEYFDPLRLQLIGKMEAAFLDRFTSEQRRKIFDKYFKYPIPGLIYSRNITPFPECVESAKEHGRTILCSTATTNELHAALIGALQVHLAPRVTRHGVLVEVYGEGILILGDSGVGKSETAMELVNRGHRLIADDAVEIKKVSARSLVGNAPEAIKHFIELRGIGVVDVRRLFGTGAINDSEKINLVIKMEPWEDGKQYDRLGLEDETINILGLDLPALTIPVKPGRNLAIIIEVAAKNNRNKRMGYNAAKELTERLTQQYYND